MSSDTEIIVTLTGGSRVDAQVGRHTIHTDQPINNGGDDTAPSPFDLFVGSMGACAGIFIQGFCAQRSIPTEGIRIIERPHFDAARVLVSVDFEIQLPPGFPERYRTAVVRVAEECSVKKAISAKPVFHVHAALATERAAGTA